MNGNFPPYPPPHGNPLPLISMAPVDMLATMDFRANPTRLLGGVQTMAKFQDYLIFCEFLDPKNRSGFWDLQLVLGVRRMLESNGFVNDETHGCFFKDEVDYPRWARRRNVGVFMVDFPTTACFQK